MISIKSVAKNQDRTRESRTEGKQTQLSIGNHQSKLNPESFYIKLTLD